MSKSTFSTPEDIRRIETETLPKLIPASRWFAGKARQVNKYRIVDRMEIGPATLFAVEVSYSSGEPETYAVPLSARDDGQPYDAVFDCAFREALFSHLIKNKAAPESEVPEIEQSNTSIIYGDKYFVKLYRKLSPGINPDAEMIRYFSDQTDFKHVAAYAGSFEWNQTSIALATSLIPNSGSAWDLALRDLPKSRLIQLGRRTGEMHLATLDLEPSPFTDDDAQTTLENLKSSVSEMIRLIGEHRSNIPEETRPLADSLLRAVKSFPEPEVSAGGLKIRIHGDYHLGQVLDTGNDFVIIDFEGEPGRSPEQRRAKYPPLRDVAGMLRSFHYAAAVGQKPGGWAEKCGQTFLAGWREVIDGSVLDFDNAEPLLSLYLAEKAAYEVIYELSNRPDWVKIPLSGFLDILKNISKKTN